MARSKPILLIEDDPDYEQLISAVLSGPEASFDVTSAPSLTAGLKSLEQSKPELIVVDLNLPDSSGYDTFLRVQERSDGVPIVVLTGLDDDERALQAIQDGAQDYLVKSLVQPRLIARSINMAVSRHRREIPVSKSPGSTPGIVMAFMGSKGGVGTSTTAINIAALLARNGLDTVAIELGHGRTGTFSLYLDESPHADLDTLRKKAPETITTADLQRCLADSVFGLRLLCPTALTGGSQSFGAEHIRALMSVARRSFQIVVLDLPPAVDESIEEVLKFSDSITVMIDRESSSIHCGTALLGHIRGLISRANKLGIAIVDRTSLEPPLPLADIKAQLKIHPLAMIPSAAPVIALAHSARTPLALLYPSDPFSLAHIELADRLLPYAWSLSPASLRSGGTTQVMRWPAIPEVTYG